MAFDELQFVFKDRLRLRYFDPKTFGAGALWQVWVHVLVHVQRGCPQNCHFADHDDDYTDNVDIGVQRRIRLPPRADRSGQHGAAAVFVVERNGVGGTQVRQHRRRHWSRRRPSHARNLSRLKIYFFWLKGYNILYYFRVLKNFILLFCYHINFDFFENLKYWFSNYCGRTAY